MMKQNLLLKLTCISIVAFIIAYVLYPSAKKVFGSYSYDNLFIKLYKSNENYKTFDKELSFNNVKTVIIKSQTSDIYIESTKEQNGKVSLTTGVNQGNAIQFKNENDTLTLELANLNQFPKSSVTVKLPKGVNALEIKNISGNTDINHIDLDKAAISSTQGNIKLQNDHLNEAIVKSIQGDIQCDVDIEKLSIKSVSGNVTLNSSNNTPQYEVKTISGNIHISIPKSVNATITIQSISGKTVNFMKTQSINSTKGFIRVKSVSGDVNIQSQTNIQ